MIAGLALGMILGFFLAVSREDARRRHLGFLLAAGLLCGAAPLLAQDANLMSELQKANAAPPDIRGEMGGDVLFAADTDTSVTPRLIVDFDAPFALGTNPVARFGGSLEMTSAPGSTVDPAIDAKNFRAMSFRVSLARYIGASGGVFPYLKCDAFFSTRLPTDPEPAERVLHGWGCGPGIRDDKGNWIDISIGRNQGADINGPIVFDPSLDPADPMARRFPGIQATVRGEISVPRTKQIGKIRGESVLNFVLPSNPLMRRRDLNRITLVADIAQAIQGDPEAPTAGQSARPPAISQPDASFGPPAPPRI